MREVDLAEPQSTIPWRLGQVPPCATDSLIGLRWYERTTIYVNIHLLLHVNFQFGSHHRPNCCERLCTSLTTNGFLSLGEHLRVAKPCNKSMVTVLKDSHAALQQDCSI